ncbi:dienelactone hydrolase family protein [bacterium]|nr:dienelactone hydrolase family protein [bacterium]
MQTILKRFVTFLLFLLLTSPLIAQVSETPQEYTFEGITFEGQAIRSEIIEEDQPGVLIFPQWKGISDHEMRWGRELAKLGYAVFVADMYGKGKRATSRKEASALAGPFYQDQSRKMMRDRANAALEQLHAQPMVDDEHIYAIGFCFGGTNTLELVRSGAELAGAVSFHGNLTSPHPAGEGEIKADLLICHGGSDPHVPWEDVTTFRGEMETVGADYRLVVYSDAVHAFTDLNAGDDPSVGAAYNEAAAEDAWKQMMRFFEEQR